MFCYWRAIYCRYVRCTPHTFALTVPHPVCDIPLGTSTISVTLDGCDPAYYDQTFVQTGVEGIWEIPAHKVNVRVKALQGNTAGDREFIMTRKFRGMNLRADLTNIKEFKNNTKVADNSTNVFAGGVAGNDTAGADMRTIIDQASNVRFQYDGILNVALRMLDRGIVFLRGTTFLPPVPTPRPSPFGLLRRGRPALCKNP